MKDKFELACKIIGLIQVVSAVFFFVFGMYLVILTAWSDLPSELSSKIWVQYLIITLLVSALSGCIGLYLMRSNNIIVCLCYPEDNEDWKTDESKPDSIKSKITKKQAEETDDSRYAPPGYKT